LELNPVTRNTGEIEGKERREEGMGEINMRWKRTKQGTKKRVKQRKEERYR
jgi:hypothetical protein